MELTKEPFSMGDFEKQNEIFKEEENKTNEGIECGHSK